MKGYKVFNKDWTCRGFQYEVGKTYEMDNEQVICGKGFHFCEQVADCFGYYSFNPNNKVAEVEVIGIVKTERNKTATNNIKIVKEISWEEMLKLANVGKGNTGISNSGDWNSGNRNSGHWNSGYYNSGYGNSGYCNSGNRNSGDRNTGDFNLSNSNTGCFCQEEKTIDFFDEPTNMTLDQWRTTEAYNILKQIKYSPTSWVKESSMDYDEKKANKDYKTQGGYLKKNDIANVNQEWWDSLGEEQKRIIKGIPNFNKEKFQQIMRIKY